MKEIIQQAQNKRYAEFDVSVKETLAQRVADKLAETGYFDRLQAAKGIHEEFPAKKEKEKENDETEDEIEDDAKSDKNKKDQKPKGDEDKDEE